MSLRTLRVGIIGAGPRSLAAIESLVVKALNQHLPMQITLFDPYPWPGAGPNYAPDQSDLCLLNIPVRIVDYTPPAFLDDDILPFAEWAKDEYGPDDFPPRAYIGRYLHERFKALQRSVSGRIDITHIKEQIVDIRDESNAWIAQSKTNQYGLFDEMLISPGQPSTALDKQMKRWVRHADKHHLDLLPAYPSDTLLASAQDWAGKIVAIRGLGLSTLDVLRMLSAGLGGTFKDGKYAPSGHEPKRILPFSLNGIAPAAKPVNQAYDKQFDPSSEERRYFSDALEETVSQDPDDALEILCASLLPAADRILSQLESAHGRKDAQQWLTIELSDPGTQSDKGPIEELRRSIAMAHNRIPPDAGYVLGQLWRKLQSELRTSINQGKHHADTATAIIMIDEGFKRYSYGPPVFAAEELLALIDCGIVSLCVVEDPDIHLIPEGWQLVEDDAEKTASVMIDGVLPNPSLNILEDPLIISCMAGDLIHPIAEGFGAHILPHASVVSKNGDAVPGLSLLGRLTLGSVIAVDGLDDCFGPSTQSWAESVVSRHCRETEKEQATA